MAFRNPGRTPASQPPGGDYWSQFEPEAEPPAAPPVTLPPNFGTAAGTAIGDTLRGTPAGTPAKPGAPTFRAGMTPEEVKAAVTQYYASRGVTPLPTSVDYWVQKYFSPEFKGDIKYWEGRLASADEFTGAGGAGGGGYAAPGYGDFSQMDTAQFQAPNLIDDPGYQFRLSEGLKGIERSAAAKGTLLTGGTLKALAGYHQGLASQEYGNAWDRAMGQFTTNYGVRRGERGDLFDRYYRTSTLGKPE